MALPIVTAFEKWISFPLSRIARSYGQVILASRSYSLDKPQPVQEFDEKMLEYIACPLSKKPLVYDKENNELISPEIGVAYPIVNGIPNLVPQDSRMIKKNKTLQNENMEPKS
ncbi:hypothetical protein CHS0354_034787 [Potamilus streckersoni]|uniref:Protein preY, mitochondrial n=1 Tax=Potamilus streckersoni TaxID=2493646 RepID=A0AAE0RST6_9BIVA|nr:hypothetical protein CHS0354_034787 [Potamilus streckersoni]